MLHLEIQLVVELRLEILVILFLKMRSGSDVLEVVNWRRKYANSNLYLTQKSNGSMIIGKGTNVLNINANSR